MTAVRIWLEHSSAEVYVYVTTDTGMADIKSVNIISRPHDPAAQIVDISTRS